MARLGRGGRARCATSHSRSRRARCPEGSPPDTLAREVREATAELGIPDENLTVHDFDVRTFPDHRQEILELLIELWNDWRPDVVFQPSLHDIHQDHQTIAAEGLRAFKRTTILGYEIPWNNFDFAYQAYISLEQRHLERKARRSRATPRSSTAATPTPSTSGTSRARTASTSTASTPRSSRSIAPFSEETPCSRDRRPIRVAPCCGRPSLRPASRSSSRDQRALPTGPGTAATRS